MELGAVLPAVPDLTDAQHRPLVWRHGRRSRIVLLGHGTACDRCAAYAAGLRDAADRFATWDGDVWIGDAREPAVASDAAHADAAVAMLRSVDGDRLRRRWGWPPDVAGVVVADPWGQVWQIALADESHALPERDELVETTRFIAIQCPECETADDPRCDWSLVR